MSSPILRALRPRFRKLGRVSLSGLTVLALATGLSAQTPSPAESRAALKARIEAAGFRVLIGMRPDSLSHGMLSPGHPALSESAAEAIAGKLEGKGLRRHGRFSLIPVVFGEVAAADLDRILADPQVEYVEPDEAMPLAAHSGGSSFRMTEELPWGITQVTAPTAWLLGGSGAFGGGVKLAYLDSGGDPNHPDLTFAGGFNPVTNSTSDWFDDIAACNGHGTHIAGTIAGRHNDFGVVGVAPEASLYAIKVFQDLSGSCLAYTSSQISGLDWAVKNGITVVSVSIGGTSPSSSYQTAISSAASKGTYMVAAAGNNGTSSMTYPGNYQDVISVASVDPGNNHSSWSNYGPNLSISAPGEGILSTMPGGSYGYKSGTSMATPHVAGVVGLILARYPGISRSELLSRLQQGALDLGAPGRDDVYGWGLARAAEAMDGTPAPPPPQPPPPPPPTPLALGVSPVSRSDTVTAGSILLRPDSATVSLSGDGAATAAWTATNSSAWLSLLTPAGIGSATLRWTRNPSGLAAGTYVDTIAVSTGALSAQVIDSLVVQPPPTEPPPTEPPPGEPPPPPVPLALSVSPASRSDSVAAGSVLLRADSATVSLSGDGAATAAWTAVSSSAWLTLLTPAGLGSGTLGWTRNPSGLAAGTYVATISVAAGALSAQLIDSLVVLASAPEPPSPEPPPPAPLTLSLSPSSRYHPVKWNETVSADSAQVLLTGTGAALAPWSATGAKPWTLLTTAAGTGSGTVRWSHNLSGLVAGTYVDTITVVASDAIGSPAWLIDTVVVASQPGRHVGRIASAEVELNGGAALRLDSVYPDSAYVDVAAGISWKATTAAAWVTLLAGSGTGPGYLHWQRSLAGMPYGISQDSIVVSSGTGAGLEVELVVTEKIVAGADQLAASLAASALFEPAKLDELRRRMLDVLGNGNGRYDVGDLLAFLDRTGYRLSGPLLARVMALPPH
jgi:subtilisin